MKLEENDHTVSRTGILRLGGRGPIDEFSLGIDGKWHRVARPAAPDQDDALDLGSALLPILVKSYGKQLAGALVGLLLVAWVVRRLRR